MGPVSINSIIVVCSSLEPMTFQLPQLPNQTPFQKKHALGMTFDSALGSHCVIYVILKGCLLVISVPTFDVSCRLRRLFVSKYFSWHTVISLLNLRRLADQCQNPLEIKAVKFQEGVWCTCNRYFADSANRFFFSLPLSLSSHEICWLACGKSMPGNEKQVSSLIGTSCI